MDNVVMQWTIAKCGLKMIPLIRGLCFTVDFDQMWPKMCPSLEGFVTQLTSTKCSPKTCPSLKDFVTSWTLTKCGLKCAPYQRTLSRLGLQPNVAQNVPFIGGLCHVSDYDQMWSKMCPSLENFITSRTSAKCGPKRASHRRTLSHLEL
jgi:hypothetical protein